MHQHGEAACTSLPYLSLLRLLRSHTFPSTQNVTFAQLRAVIPQLRCRDDLHRNGILSQLMHAALKNGLVAGSGPETTREISPTQQWATLNEARKVVQLRHVHAVLAVRNREFTADLQRNRQRNERLFDVHAAQQLQCNAPTRSVWTLSCKSGSARSLCALRTSKPQFAIRCQTRK